MSDRRFNEDEVAAIFKQATETQRPSQRVLPSGEGLTLAELQEIGLEVGISPELVHQAAASLEVTGTPTSRKFLGLPIGVGRVVNLERKLSGDEWDRLVVDLRETFDARGAVRQEGSFRQWTNGNLQVLLEPTAAGSRIRMSTVNGRSRAWMTGALSLFGVAAVSTIAALAAGRHLNVQAPVEMLVMAAGAFVAGTIGLPAWAHKRRTQMEEVARRLQ